MIEQLGAVECPFFWGYRYVRINITKYFDSNDFFISQGELNEAF